MTVLNFDSVLRLRKEQSLINVLIYVLVVFVFLIPLLAILPPLIKSIAMAFNQYYKYSIKYIFIVYSFIQPFYIFNSHKMNKSADFILGGPFKGKKQAKKPVPVQLAWKERISPQDYQGLRDTFLLFDEDGSGKIDPVQILKIFEELDLHKRSAFVQNIIWSLRQTNKPLDFDQFVDCVCSKIGEYRTKDGLRTIFTLYDQKKQGFIGFQEIKQIVRIVGENMNDDAILQMMHSTFIKNQTQSNERFSFDEFYSVIANYYSKHEK